ncbi:DNA-directed DNA polymerase I [Sulfuracidifex tepidarius]|uniref:DNA polymerase n=1 Tax=Sulfuracidifex tepidarius TaxID=1294262 RepID=A0A510DUS0_9CREN|nr:DNA-directed DNA polymerase I [Sulfuracidifex tepidarius]BBG23976.1 DNA polymerase 1 [Sulfuracidifex tepidarius]BBG26731.1 DNA polymerase 1 [Sulfuracidifex tepidarius]
MSRQLTLFDVITSQEESKKEKQDKNNGKNENRNAKEVKERSQVSAPRRKTKSWMSEAQEGKVYFLLQVDYDGEKGKAVCRLYDKETQKIYYLYDNTHHKSYFLVDLDPDKVNKITKITKDPSFDHMERVVKIDPYTQGKITLTKIVVKDPLAVKRMRDHVPKAYEAHIKYFNNYIYDLGLIPGMPYVVKNMSLREAKPSLSDEEVQEVEKAFSDSDQMTKDTSKEWMPIFESEVPDLKRVAIDIEVFTPIEGRVPDPEEAEFPIISIALAGNDGKKIVLALNREDVSLGDESVPDGVEVRTFNTEFDLLNEFFNLVVDYPVLLTFNGDDFDVPYIFFRALKLGYFPEEVPFEINPDDTKYLAGIHIDLYRFYFNKAVKTYAFDGKYNEYSLDAVASSMLGLSKVKLDKSISALDVRKLIEYNYRDSEITLKLTTFNNNITMKLIILLARMSRMGIEELTRTEVSTWIKNLYYWEHRRRNWLIPLKEDIKERSSAIKTASVIKGKGYKGAVVIDPPAGVFFNVVVLDFASLYPSIIRTWNISYETVDLNQCRNIKEVKDETGNVLHTICFDRPGITAVITGLLRDFRVKIYKKKAKQAKDVEQKTFYDVVQRAMKVFINATYGVFGAETFPLYAPAVAESVTALGRYVITSTVSHARSLGVRVLYGDTDSLFLYNPTKEIVDGMIKWVKDTFGLDIEIDKSYKFVAFSGLKKNYFGVYPDGKVDIKGMLVKKRNTPEFLKKSFAEVKDILVKVNTPEEMKGVKQEVTDKVRSIYTGLKNKDYNLDELAFKIMLSRSVEHYKKTTPQHVKAAEQLKEAGVQVLPRDIIMFVKVKTKDGVKAVQLAKLNEIDSDKYLDAVRSTFEQILKALGVSWDEIASGLSIDSFFSGF